jgi:tetratricopeptide (TPR) repeat protein
VELSELSGRRKDETPARSRGVVTLTAVEVYGPRVEDLAGGMEMQPGSASGALARASQRDRKDRTSHEQRLALEQRLAQVEAGGRTEEGEKMMPGTDMVLIVPTVQRERKDESQTPPFRRERSMRRRATLATVALAVAAALAGQASFGQGEYRNIETQLVRKYREANGYYEKAKVRFANKDFRRALKELDTCLGIIPEFADAHLMLAKIYYSEKDFPKALTEVLLAKTGFGSTAGLIEKVQQDRRFELRKRQELLEQSLSSLRAELLRTPAGQQHTIQGQIARAERDKADIDRELFEPIPNLSQLPAEYFFFHGNVLLRLQQYTEAAAQYDEALKINPGYADAANNLASLYYSAHQYEQALAILKRVEAKGATVNPELKKAIQDALK